MKDYLLMNFVWTSFFFTTHKVAWYIISVISVCMSAFVSDSNFQKPRRRKFIFIHLVYLQGIQIIFVYEGHRVKVKVIRAK